MPQVVGIAETTLFSLYKLLVHSLYNLLSYTQRKVIMGQVLEDDITRISTSPPPALAHCFVSPREYSECDLENEHEEFIERTLGR